MLNVEWNLEDALQVEREEGREEGLQEDLDIGIKQSVHSLSRFFPAEEIAHMLDIPLEQVNLSLGR